MFHNWDQFTPSNEGLTPLHGGRDSTKETTRPAIEDDMKANIYIVDGLVTMLFYPFRVFKLLSADSKKAKSFFFPLGTKVAFLPLMSFFMYLSGLGVAVQLYNVPTARNLRDLFVDHVSIGEPIVAISLYAAIATIVAAAVSHHPRFVRWEKEINSVLESVPFAQLRAPGSITYSAGITPIGESTRVEHIGVGDLATPTHYNQHVMSGLEATGGSSQRLLAGGHSPPPMPLSGNQPAMSSVIPTTVVGSAHVEYETLNSPNPRKYVPFSHILFDEVPPLTDERLHFIYEAAEWFEPQKQNRQHLDRSLAFFKEVWTKQQAEAIDKQLQRRRNRSTAARDIPDEDQGGLELVLVNPETAEWKPSDLFKFCIGDRIRRNEQMPELEVSFDGQHTVGTDQTYAISNRMWHEECALYCVDGGADTHQWQAIEALFDVVEEYAMDGTIVQPRRGDKEVATESLLLAFSGREMLRRLDVYSNGNVSSSENAMHVPLWIIAVEFLVAVLLSLSPMVVRILQGGGLYAKGSIGDFLCAFPSVFLSSLSVTTMFLFLSTTDRSIQNLHDIVDGFTEVTLGSASNKWYPVLNWYEVTNIRTWYVLREHILSCFKVHYNSRLAACFTTMILAAAWSFFALGFCLTFPSRGKPTADGWVLESLLISLPILCWLIGIFGKANEVNEMCFAHRSTLAKIQAALEEEIMLVASRQVTKMGATGTLPSQLLATQNSSSTSQGSSQRLSGPSNISLAIHKNADLQYLLDAKALLDDVRFAIDLEEPPLHPFGLNVNHHIVQFIGCAIAVNIGALLLVGSGFVLINTRWKLIM